MVKKYYLTKLFQDMEIISIQILVKSISNLQE